MEAQTVWLAGITGGIVGIFAMGIIYVLAWPKIRRFIFWIIHRRSPGSVSLPSRSVDWAKIGESIVSLKWIFKGPWTFFKWTTADILNAGLVIFWLETALITFVLLWGNPAARESWRATFQDPLGLIIYSVAFISLFLFAVTLIRQFKNKMILDEALRKRATQVAVVAWILIFVIPLFVYGFNHDLRLIGSNDHTEAPASSDSTAHIQSVTPQTPTVIEATLTGTEIQRGGTVVLDLGAGESAIVTEISRDLREIGFAGNWFDTTVWGYEDAKAAGYFGGKWKNLYCHSDIEGVEAGETLVILDMPCEAPEERVFQFPDGRKTLKVTNGTDETLSLTLYFNSLQEPAPKTSDFRGSAKFEIRIEK